LRSTRNALVPALALHDGLYAVALTAVWVLVPATPALAYVDPSVMTYTIQALAAVAVALSAVLGVAFRRTRRALMRLLHIDEGAGRVAEPAVSRIDPAGKSAADAACHEALAAADGAARGGKVRDQKTSVKWPKRLLLALLVSVSLVVTYFVVAPFELLAANTADLTYGLDAVWPVLVRAAVIAAVVLALVVSVTRGRAFDVVLALVSAVTLCGYLQAMFLNGTLPITNGGLVDWGLYKEPMVVSFAVWAALIAAAVVVAALKPSVSRLLNAVLAGVLIIIQSVAIASIWLNPDTAPVPKSQETVYTEQGLFDVSSKKNVVVIVLDMTDTQYVEETFADNPTMFDALDGFTWYQNSVGSLAPTRYGCSYLLTGQLPQEGEDFQDYVKSSVSRSTYLKDISDLGYDIGVYSDAGSVSHGDPSAFAGLAKNVHPLDDGGESGLDEKGTVRVMYKAALYRDLPWMIKPFLWYYTDELNQRMSTPKEEADDLGDVPYNFDDPSFYAQLKTRGLSINNDGETGSFRFIHLLGAHFPYTMDAQGERVDGETTYDQQLLGSFKIVSTYLDDLKELGVYDNTTVIVTADHGRIDFMSDTPIERPTSPILFVKPAGAAHTGLSIDATTPVWAPDVLATVIDQVSNGNQTLVAKYGTPAYNVAATFDDKRERAFDAPTWDGNYTPHMYQFSVIGPVEDWSSWQLTGVTWETNER
jgi:antitoxin (DNA-binding transcriptional repressor) of toxin-antitoxin stability system